MNSKLHFRFHDKIAELFTADLRSLASFRIVLALIALSDLYGRAANLHAHYTDTGVMPRSVLLEQMNRRWSISLHLVSGDIYIQAALFSVAVAAALALLVGYRTRLATFVVWVFLSSVQARNPLVLSAADTLLRVLYFWALFLPLGACWSLDSKRGTAPRSPSTRVLSIGTVALFAQLAFVYVFTALLKSGAEWRTDYTAIYYALSIDQLTTPVGQYLLQFPELLRALTIGTFWLEALGPLLLFSPVFTAQVRTATIAAFMSLHVGIAFTMSIDYFPYLSGLCMVCLLPPWFWNQASRPALRVRAMLNKMRYRLLQPLPRRAQTWQFAVQTPQTAGTTPWKTASRGISWLHSAFSWAAPAIIQGKTTTPGLDGTAVVGMDPTEPATSTNAPRDTQDSMLRLSGWANALAAFFLMCVFIWNLSTVTEFTVPAPLRAITKTLALEQRWGMFAPRPMKADGWFILPGTLRDGTQLDVMGVTRGEFDIREGVSWEKPHLGSAAFTDANWRKYITRVASDKYKGLRRYLGGYICREWNGRHDGPKQLLGFKIYFVREYTLPNYQQSPPKQQWVWSYRCF